MLTTIFHLVRKSTQSTRCKTHIKRMLFTFFSLLILVPGITEAATLTVGSGKSYSSIQSAVNNASCGDTISIYAKTYYEEVHVYKFFCSQNNQLVIRAAEPGVIIDGGGNRRGIRINDSDWVTVDGLTFKNCTNREGRSTSWPLAAGAIDLIQAGHCTIKNNTATTTVGGNENVMGGYHSLIVCDFCADNAPNLTLENNRFTSSGAGVNVFIDNSSDARIRNNEFANALRYPIRIFKGNRSIIEKNYIHSNYDGYRTFSLYLRDSEDLIIRYNIADFSNSNAFGAMTVWDDVSSGGSSQMERWEVYNNLFIAGSRQEAAVRITGTVENSNFYNNIFVHPSYSVVFSAAREYGGSSGITFDYNIFDSPSAYKNSNGSRYTDGSRNMKNTDPRLLKSGNKPDPYYEIAETSPARNEGRLISGYSGTDFAGNSVPYENSVDVGAFEYKSGTTTVNLPPNPPVLISID